MTDIPETAAVPTTGISLDTSRLASSANLKKAGEKFESLFIGLMMKSMRQAGLGDGLLDSKSSDTFRDMQDRQIADSMAAHQPIGIGRAMTDFLARSKAAPRSSAVPDDGNTPS